MSLIVGTRFGHAQDAAVQRLQRRFDRVAGVALGVGGDRVAGIPRGFDGGFQRGVHGDVGHGGGFLWFAGVGAYSPVRITAQCRQPEATP